MYLYPSDHAEIRTGPVARQQSETHLPRSPFWGSNSRLSIDVDVIRMNERKKFATETYGYNVSFLRNNVSMLPCNPSGRERVETVGTTLAFW